jgi:hypothetical protein
MLLAVASVALPVVCLIAGAIWWRTGRLRIRSARTAPAQAHVRSVISTLDTLGLCPEQEQLTHALADLRQTEDGIEAATAEARRKALPIPPLPGPNEDAETVLQRVADLFGDRRFAMAVAGGEQLFASLAEAVSPHAMDHLSDAARILWDDGMIQAALTAATANLPAGLLQYAGQHAIHNILAEHGASTIDALTHIPEQAIGTLHDAVAEAGHAIMPGDQMAAHAFHFPIVTLIRSTIHETALVLDNRLSAARAAMHVVVTTAGTGLGAFGGGKLGALIGTAIAPGIGTLVGGAIGSFVGGIGGSFAAHGIKSQPLRAAAENLEAVVVRAKGEVQRSALELARRVNNRATQIRVDYDSCVLERPVMATVCARDPELVAASRAVRTKVESELKARTTEALRAIDRVDEHIPARSLLTTFFGLNINDDVQALKLNARAKVSAWMDRQLASLPSSDSNPHQSLAALAGLPIPATAASAFPNAVRDLRRFAGRYMKMVAEWLGRIAVAHRAGAAAIADYVRSETERHRALFQSWQQEVDAAHAVVVRERHALGLD